MKSIWIITIDTSGSMNGGFGGNKPKETGLVKYGNWNTKIEAAKEILIKQIESIRKTEIAIIEFNTEARILFQGIVDDKANLIRQISSITAAGGTNIPGALELSNQILNNEVYDTSTVLTITDGLADPREAGFVSNKIKSSHKNCRLSVILIDSSNEGKRVAEEIVSDDGQVQFAESYADLSSNIEQSKNEQISKAIGMMDQQVNSNSFQLFKNIRDREAYKKELRLHPYQIPIGILFPKTYESQFTVDLLEFKIVPLLRALEQLEKLLNKNYHPLIIHAITKSSPVKASISGIAQALEILERMIMPWKRNHVKKIAEIEIQNKQIEIDTAKYELEKMKSFAGDDKVRQQINKMELERKLIENEEMRVELFKKKYELAKRIIEENNPGITDDQKTEKILKILPSIEKIVTSEIDIKYLENN